MSHLNQLEVRKTAEDFVNLRNQIIAKYKQALQCDHESQELAKQIGQYVYPSHRHGLTSIEPFITELDRRIWKQAFEYTGLAKVMDKQARSEFNRSLEGNECPEFSLETMQATYLALSNDAEEIFNRGVVNVFKWKSEKYKTNKKDAFTIGRKLIIEWVFNTGWDNTDGTVSFRHGSDRAEEIDDIDRIVCRTLDVPFNRDGLVYRISQQFKERGKNLFEDDNYKIRGYKNGNMHLEFKKQKIIDGINQAIASWCGSNTLGDDSI